MASDKISQKISDLYEHIEGLKMKGMTDPETAAEVLSDALDEMQVSLEELSAADEELCQQNEELILTQSKLQESEEKYRELVENANSIIIKMDNIGRISFFNEYAQKFFGYSSEEILGQDVKVLVPPIESVSGRSLEEMADEIIRSPDDFIENINENIRKNGDRAWISWRNKAIRDARGDIVGNLAIGQDITERKQAEEALKAERAKLTAILESIPEEVWFADKNMHVTLVNRAITKNFNKSVDIGQQIEKIAAEYEVYRSDGTPRPPEEAPLLRAIHGETVRDQEEIVRIPATGELRHRLVTASPVTDPLGNTLGSVSIVRDITDHKKAEEALLKSEERYRGLFNSMTEGFALHEVICDEKGVPCDFRFLDINPAFEKLTGLKREDVIGRTHNEVLPDDDPRWIREYGAVALTGKPVQFENYSPALGRHYEVFAYCPAPRQFAVVFMDITERKRAEEALRESEEKYRLLFESMIEGFLLIEMILDDQGIPISYRYLGANPALEKLTHLKRGDIIGRDVREVLPGVEPYWIEAFGQVAMSGKPLHIEQFSKDLGGWYDVYIYCPKPGQAALIYTNTTERKRAEEERERLLKDIEAERARLQAILDALPVGVTIADASGHILVNNDSLHRIWGGKAPLSRGVEEYAEYKGWWADTGEALNPGDWGLARAITKGETSVGEVIDIQRFDGTRGTILNSSAPVRDADGKIIGAVVILQDITERKAMEEELRRSRDELELRVQERTADLSKAKEELEVINEELQVELEEHRRLESELLKAKDMALEAVQAKASFLANMSHELRTPMNAIIGFTGLLLDEPLSPEQRDYLERARNSGNILLSLINDILEFSRVEKQKVKLEKHPFSLRACLEESLGLVSVQAKDKGLDLAYTLSYGTPDAIIGDPGRLRQILANLLSNAVKFTDKGSVSVSLSSKPLGQNRLRLLFEVKDTGIGISQDSLPKLFQPFSQVDTTTSSKYGGTGLGLAISKSLVELMGGKIWADSEPGKGSKFSFNIEAEVAEDIPTYLEKTGKSVTSDKLAEQYPLRILIAEDNPSNQKVLQLMLERMGYRADCVADGREVLNALENRPYDLVFMDVKMPGMDGIEATHEIRKRWQKNGPKIVAITAYALGGDREKCLKAGMDDYIAKPVQKGELANVLKRFSQDAQ